MPDTSMQMPPASAATPPSREVPVPKGTMGSLCFAQSLTMALTSSVEVAKATPSGGKLGW